MTNPAPLLEVRCSTRLGVFRGLMPDFSTLEIMSAISDVGLLSLSYPTQGLNASFLSTHRGLFKVTIGGSDTITGILEDIQTDEAAETGLYTVTMRDTMAEFESATLYPPNWPTQRPIFTHYANTNAGAMLRAQITASQGRGELNGWTVSFTSSVDSAGNAWNMTFTTDWEGGTPLLKIIQDLYSQGIAEAKVVGRRLDLYNFGTMGTNRHSSVILKAGQDFLDAPSHESSRGMMNVALVQGDAGTFVEVVDSASVATYGRLARPVNAGSVTDTGLLTIIGQSAIALSKDPRDQKVRGLKFTPNSPKPFVDYFLGDIIGVDNGSGPGPLRVRTLALKADSDGNLGGAVTLNDKFDALEVQFNRQIQGLAGGSGGVTSITAGTKPSTPDLTIPSDVTTISVSSVGYLQGDGSTQDVMTATWNQVTTNTDGTACTDLEGYQARYRWGVIGDGGTNWLDIQTVSTEQAIWSNVRSNQAVVIQVRAYDTTGHYSNWASFGYTTVVDNAPPTAPSTPVVDTTAFAGTLRITWDGLDNVGQPMPADFRRVEVHVSGTSGFTPSQATMRDEFTTPSGGITSVTWPVGSTGYVKFVAVDTSNNRSASSTEASGTARQATDGELASLSVGKLTAGSLIADVTISARIKTANTGQRVELNSIGLQAFNSGGSETFRVDAATGGVIMAGTFSSAISGDRVEIGTGTSYSGFGGGGTAPTTEIRFVNATTTKNSRIFMAASSSNNSITMRSGGNTFGEVQVTDNNSFTGTAFIRVGNSSSTLSSITLTGNTITIDPSAGTVQIYNLLVDSYLNLLGGSTTTTSSPHIFASSAAIRIGVSSQVYCQDFSTASVYKPINASAFTVNSSKTTKQNVKEHGAGLRAIRSLSTIQFDRPDDHTRLGVLAEEVAAVAPHATVWHHKEPDEDGMPIIAAPGAKGAQVFGVDIMGLLSVTIAALQELDKKVDALRP